MKIHKLFHLWLSGSTCKRAYYKHSIIAENENYIIFKHTGHSEYLNRMSGYAYCETYSVLYNKKTDEHDIRNGYKYEHKWPSKNSKKQILLDCKQFYDIEFSDDYVSEYWIEQEPKYNALLEKSKNMSMFGNIKL